MAKGSVRKKGKKWYYRFYVEDESGNRVQKEFPGTESKSETESLLRKAMEDYEDKKFIAKSDNITVGGMLDLWAEESLKPGNLSNGTVTTYLATIEQIKKHPIGARKLRKVTADHLQAYADYLSFGCTLPDGTVIPPKSKGYLRSFSAVLQGAFKFAVFPKRLISFNPMQYVVFRVKKDEVDLFAGEDEEAEAVPIIPHDKFLELEDYLRKKGNPALLPIQIAYYTGLRIGEVCGLTWQDINLEEQYLTVRRSIRYNGKRHKTEIGPTKRKKVRTVDFCDTLTDILRKAKAEQHRRRFEYGGLYKLNFYKTVSEKGRKYHELYTLPRSEDVPEDYNEISLVCLREDGALESPSTIRIVCRTAKKRIPGLEDFHFHMIRHTYTTNLLANGAAPKDVQELLGHSDITTTMGTYAHGTRETKRTSARLMDKVAAGK